MNTVSMKVDIPTSRKIMGNGNKKVETPVNYEEELANTEVASCIGDLVEICPLYDDDFCGGCKIPERI